MGYHSSISSDADARNKPALIANKKSAGRHKDLADVEELKRINDT